MSIARSTTSAPEHASVADAAATRRRFLGGAAAVVAAPWLARYARGADVARFSLGVASGQPRADGMVLWTRVMGDALPERVAVRWEVADDEQFRHVVARGKESAQSAWAHSVHAEPAGLAPARWYWYRFQALGGQSAVGRTRTAPAAGAAASLRFAIASCQRWDVGHYAAWRHAAAANLDLIFFLGDYIYEYATRKDPVRSVEGGEVFTLEQYRARYATYKSDPLLQAAHAAAPWLLVWDDHEVANDYSPLRGEDLAVDMRARRAAAYRAYWEHMPFPASARPVGADMRIFGRLDWGSLARIHLVDDRQYRDPQVCPREGRGGSNTVALAQCPALADPARTLLGAEQEAWLAAGWDLERPWNLLAQQTLMARFTWLDPAIGGGTYWTDGWNGYAPARTRLLSTVAAKRVPGVVVLGGDVHTNYVADLKTDFDDPRSPAIASEFCGTSITSLSVAQRHIDDAREFNPHIHYGRGDQRGYMRFELDARELRASLEVVDRPTDAESGVTTAARFVVDAARPGPRPA
ncbi:MAG TPA: alkaline phosphatase D family protein [Caldimonas sp.]|nr:alkaline phosphatase D family protein [Caldimonas sp.]HEX4233754.1 alkaline phosphatase D family protein [Caldimonas sp.]